MYASYQGVRQQTTFRYFLNLNTYLLVNGQFLSYVIIGVGIFSDRGIMLCGLEVDTYLITGQLSWVLVAIV